MQNDFEPSPASSRAKQRTPNEKENPMAVKKPGKKVVKKGGKKSVKKSVKKGDVYQCGVCGLAVTVDEVCGCVDACDIICCEKPMEPKKRT
jgi:hypothetical protein